MNGGCNWQDKLCLKLGLTGACCEKSLHACVPYNDGLRAFVVRPRQLNEKGAEGRDPGPLLSSMSS